jgi:hypothetical protein
VVQVSLQVQVITVQYTAAAPRVAGFWEPSAEGVELGQAAAGQASDQSCVRLDAAAAQVLMDLPTKLTSVSVQQLQVDAGVQPAAASSRVPSTQQQQCGSMYTLLLLQGLQLRHLKQQVALVRVAAQRVASRVHIDGILAVLSVATDALTVAAAAQQRQVAGSSPLTSAAHLGLPQLQAPSPPLARPPSGAGAVLASVKAKQKAKPVIEWDIQNLEVSADVCDHDQVALKLASCSGSTLLNQAVVNGLQLTMNGAELLAVEHLSVQHLLKGVGVAPTAEEPPEDTPFAGGSSPSSSPAGVARPATAAAAAGSTVVCPLQAPVPWQQLGSREPSPQQDPALYERQMRRQLEGRARCEVGPERTLAPS